LGTKLPDALRPWQPELSDLPPELAIALAGSIRRLAPAVGPLQALSRLGEGEPDGFAGLTRRGPYDRLLVSEWMLAEEIPDEFLRRAADGELGFLHLRRLEPASSRRSVVLFDSGPDQLGGPRIAHIAALIVLARRAREGGAELIWGSIQGETTRSGVSGEDIDFLRSCRQPRRAQPEDLERWEQSHGPFTQEDDLWLVGAPSTVRRLEPPGNWMAVGDAIALDRRALDVEIRVRRSRRRVQLELPDDRLCAQLLRGETALHSAVQGTTLRVDPESAMWFSHDAKRLIFLTEEGDLVAVHAPNSPTMAAKVPPGRTRRLRLRDGARFVAGGWHGRRLLALSMADEVIFGDTRWGAAEWARPLEFVAPERPSQCMTGYLGYGVGITGPSGIGFLQALTMIDGAGVCWVFPEDKPAKAMVASALALPLHAVLFREHGRLKRLGCRGGPEDLGVEAPVAAVTGEHGWAAESESGRWVLDGRVHEVPTGASIRGLSTDERLGAVLVGLSEDSLNIVLCGREGRAAVPGPGRPMVDLCVSLRRDMVAWRTEDGAIAVYSLPHAHILRRITPEEEA